MPLRRREVELSVERPLGTDRPQGVVRLSARFETGDDGGAPKPEELARELDRLTADLDALTGPPIAAAPITRADRDLSELVGTYRPRQRELIDLLRADGDLTPTEHALLIQYLAAAPEHAEREAEATPTRETERLIATVPIDRPTGSPLPRAAAGAPATPPKSLESARPVAELLETYRISSLRQAGAVRARRQISFAEYMALKRHFEEEESRSPPRKPDAQS